MTMKCNKMARKMYSLTWQTFADHMQRMMEHLMTSDDFTDVTLISDDKKSMKTHRNILSACSPVFKKILQMETQSNHHPVIYLRGIQYTELEAMLQFIYLGETRVHEERLSEFISAAKSLEIEDLVKAGEVGDMRSEQETGELSAEAQYVHLKQGVNPIVNVDDTKGGTETVPESVQQWRQFLNRYKNVKKDECAEKQGTDLQYPNYQDFRMDVQKKILKKTHRNRVRESWQPKTSIMSLSETLVMSNQK